MQVAFYLAGEITQVIDSIPWVRCASGNVLFCLHLPHCTSLLVWIVAVEFMTAYHDTQLGRRHPVEYSISAKSGCVLTRRNSDQQ